MVAESDKKKWSTKEAIWAITTACMLVVQTLYLQFSLRLAIQEEMNKRIADVRVLEERIKYLERQLPFNDKRTSLQFHQQPAEKPEYELVIVPKRKKTSV